MERIRQLFAQLVGEMTSRGAAVTLQAGLPTSKIARLATKLPYPLTPELIQLYECCNGSLERSPNSDSFIDLMRFLPLEEAIHLSGNMRLWFKDDPEVYSPTWFPLLYADSGDCSCVECGEGPAIGNVISYDPEMGNSTEFTSLESMLATVIQYWIEGAYVAIDGKVEYAGPPYTKLTEIGRRMNPGTDYWD